MIGNVHRRPEGEDVNGFEQAPPKTIDVHIDGGQEHEQARSQHSRERHRPAQKKEASDRDGHEQHAAREFEVPHREHLRADHPLAQCHRRKGSRKAGDDRTEQRLLALLQDAHPPLQHTRNRIHRAQRKRRRDGRYESLVRQMHQRRDRANLGRRKPPLIKLAAERKRKKRRGKISRLRGLYLFPSHPRLSPKQHSHAADQQDARLEHALSRCGHSQQQYRAIRCHRHQRIHGMIPSLFDLYGYVITKSPKAQPPP